MQTNSSIHFGETYRLAFREQGTPKGQINAVRHPISSNWIHVSEPGHQYNPDNNLSDYIEQNHLAAQVIWSSQGVTPGWYLVTDGPKHKDYSQMTALLSDDQSIEEEPEDSGSVLDVGRQNTGGSDNQNNELQRFLSGKLNRSMPTITLEYQPQGDEQNPYIHWTNQPKVLEQINAQQIWKLNVSV